MGVQHADIHSKYVRNSAFSALLDLRSSSATVISSCCSIVWVFAEVYQCQ